MTDEKKAEKIQKLTEDLEKAAQGRKEAPQQPSKAQVMQPITLTMPAHRSREWDGIAVLGSNPHTVADAPFDDPRWRIYACSPHNIEQRTLPRVNEWFEVHIPITHPTRQYEYLRRLEDNNVAQNPPHCEVTWLRDMGALPRFKDGQPFPEALMEQIWGPFYKTSSIALMLAKAIYDCCEHGIPKLGIWGVMQASETEYLYQRPNIQQFIWEANKLGIHVVVPRSSGLLEPPKELW